MTKTKPWWRRLLCRFNRCHGRVEGDEHHIWWRCGTCGELKDIHSRLWKQGR